MSFHRAHLAELGDALRDTTTAFIERPNLWLHADDRASITARLGRHGLGGSIARVGDDWRVAGDFEMVVKHAAGLPDRAARLHREAIAPHLVAAGFVLRWEESSAHPGEGIDWHGASWEAHAPDAVAAARQLLALLRIDTAWSPDGRVCADAYRPIDFDRDPAQASVYFHAATPAPAGVLVARAVGCPPSAVLLSPLDGPVIAGKPTRWMRWRLAAGAPSGLSESLFAPDDPSDPAYPTRDGLVARVGEAGPTYVACRGTRARVRLDELGTEILAVAALPFYSASSRSPDTSPR